MSKATRRSDAEQSHTHRGGARPTTPRKTKSGGAVATPANSTRVQAPRHAERVDPPPARHILIFNAVTMITTDFEERNTPWKYAEVT